MARGVLLKGAMRQPAAKRRKQPENGPAPRVSLPVRFHFGESGPVLLTLNPTPSEFRERPRARFRVLVRTTWPAAGNQS